MASKPKLTWSEVEDEVLLAIVQGTGAKKWKAVLQEFRQVFPGTTKTYKQCRERWFNHVNPLLKKGPYSSEEKQQIFRLHQRYGNQWNLIAKEMPWRSDSSIKTFFYAEIKKVLKWYNRNNPQNRIMRTLRSLVRDEETTKIFQLVESTPEEPTDQSQEPTQEIQDFCSAPEAPVCQPWSYPMELWTNNYQQSPYLWTYPLQFPYHGR